MRAAESSHGAAAYREEATLLSQAMSIAARLSQPSLVTDLCARRGAAYARVGMWAEARPDLETAISELPPERVERRAELLLDLAGVCFWGAAHQLQGWDIHTMQRYAREGQALAEQVGRDDLVAGMMGWLAAAEQSAGELLAASDLYERALPRFRACRRPSAATNVSLVLYPANLYLRGRIAEAVERGRESVKMCRGLADPFVATFGHPHLGLALAASGRYEEAMRVFDEARQLGVKYEVWPFHARAIAMSAGFHLDVFDFAGNEALAEEARERGRLSGFQPSAVSASLDLMFNFARRHEVSRAEKLVTETAEAVAKTGGWHRWLWELRFAQARAEIALAREDWVAALRYAEDSIAQSHARGRVKYEVAGLGTRAKALAALGRKPEAIADLRKALELSRPVGDPAMFLRASTALLAIEGDDALLAEACAAAQRIVGALPNEEMRSRFLAAEPVRLLGRLD